MAPQSMGRSWAPTRGLAAEAMSSGIADGGREATNLCRGATVARPSPWRVGGQSGSPTPGRIVRSASPWALARGYHSVMGRFSKGGLFLCAVLLLACGSSIDVVGPQGGGEPSSGSGAGSTSTSGTGGSTTGSSGTGGATTSSGTSTTSSGTSSTSSGSSSGWLPPPSEWCSDCAEPAVDGPCAWAWEACSDHFACNQLLKCHTDCEWTQECNEACDDIIPSGVPLFQDLIFCVACDLCGPPCAGSSLMVYCN